ncbi:MAG TPA: hypothetical protein VFJ43_02690 [Bacteroidia bacterium]|nr:hypothetical protein [Bacteroidia bacterium]
MNSISPNVMKKEDLSFACYELREDGIVVLRLIDELMIDLEKAKLMNTALGKMTIDKPRKVFVLNGRYTSADDEARNFLASTAKLKQIEKVAVTIHSLSQRILANFFIKVNKPPFPIRFFTSAEQAEKWLVNG